MSNDLEVCVYVPGREVIIVHPSAVYHPERKKKKKKKGWASPEAPFPLISVSVLANNDGPFFGVSGIA